MSVIHNYRFPHCAWETMGALFYSQPKRAQQIYSVPAKKRVTNSEFIVTVRLNENSRRLVKATRQEHGYTQEQLANKLYVKVADLKALERGDRPVLKHIADMVLFSLNVQLDPETSFF